jgi:hypothetical protein
MAFFQMPTTGFLGAFNPFRTESPPQPPIAPTGDCPVCLETLGENPFIPVAIEVIQTTCGHHFHRPCLEHWVAIQQNTCPLCRQANCIPQSFFSRVLQAIRRNIPEPSETDDDASAMRLAMSEITLA